jgi:hypothetical protein
LEDLMKALEEVAGRGEEPNEGQPLGGGGFQSRTTAMLQPQAVQDDSIICNIRLLPSAADDAGAATLPLASETKGSTGVEVAGDGEAIDDDL